MAKPRNSRSKSKIPAAPVAAPQPQVVEAAPVVDVVAKAAPIPAPIPAINVVAKAVPTHEEIARRAYELWLQRGAPHGTHLEDWLSAERELRTHAA